MSNVIEHAIRVLNMACDEFLRRDAPDEIFDGITDCLVELQSYGVVEGYTSHSDLQEWPGMVLAIGPTPSDARWRTAILLAEKEETP